MNNTLLTCLNTLSDGHIKRLLRHVAKKTPILCGTAESGRYFIYGGVADPVILASYENGAWTEELTHGELHPDVEKLYQQVAYAVPHSGYANTLEEMNMYEVWHVITTIGKQRGFPIYKTGKLKDGNKGS